MTENKYYVVDSPPMIRGYYMVEGKTGKLYMLGSLTYVSLPDRITGEVTVRVKKFDYMLEFDDRNKDDILWNAQEITIKEG